MHSKPGQQQELDLRKVKFGKGAAEIDDFLCRDYVNNTALESVIYGKASIITGQKGSGKSAIFRIINQLPKYNIEKNKDENISDYLDELNDKFIVSLNETHNLDAYKMLFSQRATDGPNSFKVLWMVYISVLVANKIIKEEEYRLLDFEYLKRLRMLSKPFLLNKKGSLLLTELVLERLKSLNVRLKIPFKGFEAELESKGPKIDKKDVSFDLVTLLKLENEIIKEWHSTCYILIDRIDDLYKYDNKKMNELIQGLFLAIEELRLYRYLQPIIFIRKDIFDRAGIIDADKLRDSTIDISWNCEQTFRFLAKRLIYDSQIEKVLSPKQIDRHTIDLIIKYFYPSVVNHINHDGREDNLPFKGWLQLHLQNSNGYISPRDLIVFLNYCIDYEIKKLKGNIKYGSPIISEQTVTEAYKQLSRERFDDMKNITGYEDILNIFQDAKCRDFTLPKAKSLLKTGNKEDREYFNIFYALESVGFLKRDKISVGMRKYYYKYSIPPLYTANWDF